MAALPDPLKSRKADYPIDKIFLKRWSPRAMSGKPISDDQLNTLLEAARWAPSTHNEQEWRYLYARDGDPNWKMFLDLLAPANQVWCKNSAVLMVILSKKTFTRTGKPNPVHTFDTGASFENLALQGAAMGLVIHGMAGFDRERTRMNLNVPDDFDVEAMVAVGQPGDPDQLPVELRERETPSDRKPIAEIARAGKFSF